MSLARAGAIRSPGVQPFDQELVRLGVRMSVVQSPGDQTTIEPVEADRRAAMTERPCREYLRRHRSTPRRVGFKPWVRAAIRISIVVGALLVVLGVSDSWSVRSGLKELESRGKTVVATVVSKQRPAGKPDSCSLTVAFQDADGTRRRFTQRVAPELFAGHEKDSPIELTYVPENPQQACLGGVKKRLAQVQSELERSLALLLFPAVLFAAALGLVFRERNLMRNGVVCAGTIEAIEANTIRFRYRDRSGHSVPGASKPLPLARLLGCDPARLLEQGQHEPVVYLPDSPARAALPRHARFCRLED